MASMSKAIVFLFLVIVFLGCYILIPGLSEGINNGISKTVLPAFGGVVAGVTSSSAWLTYIQPNLFPIGIIFGVFTSILAYKLLGSARDRYRIWRAPMPATTMAPSLARPAPTYSPAATAAAPPPVTRPPPTSTPTPPLEGPETTEEP